MAKKHLCQDCKGLWRELYIVREKNKEKKVCFKCRGHYIHGRPFSKAWSSNTARQQRFSIRNKGLKSPVSRASYGVYGKKGIYGFEFLP